MFIASSFRRSKTPVDFLLYLPLGGEFKVAANGGQIGSVNRIIGDQLAVSAHMAAGVLQHALVFDRLFDRRFGDDRLFSGYRHPLACLGDYGAGDFQRLDDVNRAGDDYSDAADGFEIGV